MARAADIERALSGLRFRCIGPFRGGRVVAVAGDGEHRQVFYMGSTGGGVWKTEDAGLTWENVSDGHFRRASVGALAVAPSDPNVVYAGMGEACLRDNVAHGDGVYRSTDAGRTWVHRGLADTRHIGKVRVHPADPDVVFVAALGHAHGPNAERGVYRSRDGGQSWQRVLFRDDRSGAVDLALEPSNPRVIFAATWQALRTPWKIASVGPGSGLFRSTDGGDTWTELTAANGLPRPPLGRIGVTPSAARSGRVYAIVEAATAADGGIFRSDDGGERWERVSNDRSVRERDYYYQHIYADPLDAETVWVLAAGCFRSVDGGRTFAGVSTPHADHHDLWIDPSDPQRMIIGDDGGASVSVNGGGTWSPTLNQPTAEIYHVTTDTRVPYRVYGAQQDNTTISVPSRSMRAGITLGECYDVGGGESGYVEVRPDDPDVVFAGSFLGALTRYDHRTGQCRNIEVWPEASAWGLEGADVRHRWPWTFPILISPHDPSVLYVAADHVFRSTDEGASWTRISPDLTRNDRAKLEDKPATENERYCTVFALAESPVRRGVLWAGSDDGLVHLSRDGGRTWADVTPAALPPWAMISTIEPSPHDAGTAYVAAHRYRLDDFRPYMFRTRDLGRTWTAVMRGIPRDEFTRVVRADPVRRGLLYCGTEVGLYVSFDDGGRWHGVRADLPVVPIHDLRIKDGDLVVATHGRSFWIADDITPLRSLVPLPATPSVFAPRETIRYRTAGSFTERGGKGGGESGTRYRAAGAGMVSWRTGRRGPMLLDAGENPPDGVLVHYWLPRDVTDLELSVRDRAGNEVARSDGKDGALPTAAGLHRFVWDTRTRGATRLKGREGGPDMSLGGGAERALEGPLVPPGTYTVRLRIGARTSTAAFELRADPRGGVSPRDLEAQHALLVRLRDALSAVHDAVNGIRALRARAAAMAVPSGRARSGPRTRARAALRAMDRVERALVQTEASARRDAFTMPTKLNAKLAGLILRVASADAAPTRQSEQVAGSLIRQADALVARYREASVASGLGGGPSRGRATRS